MISNKTAERRQSVALCTGTVISDPTYVSARGPANSENLSALWGSIRPTRSPLGVSRGYTLAPLHSLVLAAALIAGPLYGTTVQRMELSQLVSTSDNIVQGRVESVEARFENKAAFTYVSVIVDDPLKGEPRRAVLVRQLGGKIGALNVSAAGMPRFKPGDSVILFLRNRRDGTFDVVGLSQGKYDIVNDSAIANVSGISVLDPKTGITSDAGFVDKAPLEEFKARIRGLVR